MGQILIRNLEDDLIADYREAAERNHRSLEAELREVLRVLRPMGRERLEQAGEALRRIRAMTPQDAVQTPSGQLVREDRDGNRE